MRYIFNFFTISIPQNRIYGLDILRALAILFVVIGHGNIVYVPSAHHIKHVLSLVVFDGVSIFFVLSGFLIGGILIRTLEKHPATFSSLFTFLKKRWFRTLPNYFFILCFLLATVSFNRIAWIENPIKGHFFIKYFFFLQNLSTGMPQFFPESWSLCIEEWFYLTVPFLIFVLVGQLKLTPKKAVLIVAVFVIFIVTLYRYYLYIKLEPSAQSSIDYNIAFQVVTRLDSLMYGLIGVFISFYYNSSWLKYRKLFLIIGIAILFFQKYLPLISPHQLGIYDSVFTFSLTSIGTLFLMPFMSNYKSGSGFLYKILTFISLISYSIYLLNLSPVIYTIIPFLTLYIEKVSYFSVIRYLLFWFISIFGAVILYKFIEMPFMRLREKK